MATNAERSAVAWAAFCARVAALGGSVIEPVWLGANARHRVRCAAGHDSTAKPSHVKDGIGICRTCAGLDPAVSEKRFRDQVAAQGGTCLFDTWRNVSTPHRVRCAKGHIGNPMPVNVNKGDGICRTCARCDPAAAFDEFKARLQGHGAILLRDAWLGSRTAHRIVCAQGHRTTCTPNALQQGANPCDHCRYAWGVFYVVRDPRDRVVKFGISSRASKQRLGAHRSAGFTQIVRVIEPCTDALAVERAVRQYVAAHKFRPVKGREYYEDRALPAILSAVYRMEGVAA